MKEDPQGRWLVFNGADITRLLRRLGITRVGLANALNVTATTIWRWERNRVPPTAGSMTLLFILLWGNGIIHLSKERPSWWSQSRKKAGTAADGEEAGGTGEPLGTCPELFQFWRLPKAESAFAPKEEKRKEMLHLAASSRGIDEARCLGNWIAEAMMALKDIERPEAPKAGTTPKKGWPTGYHPQNEA